MVRFQWQVEEGVSASVAPGQLWWHKDTGVVHAVADVEVRPVDGGGSTHMHVRRTLLTHNAHTYTRTYIHAPVVRAAGPRLRPSLLAPSSP